jgi:two-component system response regulator MprA
MGDWAVKILVVDDEAAVRSSLVRALRFEGYETAEAPDGQQALDTVAVGGVDAMVLDLMMPVLGGIETCRRLRSAGDRTPVLMLTARDAVGDRVAGLDAGADDYLPKPFDLDELLARVRALLRRGQSGAGAAVLTFADLRLDTAAREVTRAGVRLELTRTEFALLEAFMHHPRQVLSRGVLFEQVWEHQMPAGSNTLDVFVGYLRRKTETGGSSRLLHTVRGVGFVLREQP